MSKRENNKFNDAYWYRYSRSQNTDKQKTSKLLIPHVVKEMRCAFDQAGHYAIKNVGVNGIHLKDQLNISPLFVMAILNSNIASFFISKISIFLSGGYYAANKQFASLIPFPSIDNKSTKHHEIVKLVTSLIQLKNNLPKVKLPKDLDKIKNHISASENRINALVYEIYGITSRKDIETIESNIK